MTAISDTHVTRTIINDRMPIGWRGRVHVRYRTTRGDEQVRGCESRSDALTFCEGVDRIDLLLGTEVSRKWVMLTCTCDRSDSDGRAAGRAGGGVS